MTNQIPCQDCHSKDGKTRYTDLSPCQHPCIKCDNKKFKSCKVCNFNKPDCKYQRRNINAN